MPDDGSENEGASQLDTAPEPAPQPRGGVRVRRTKKGSVQVDFREAQPQEQQFQGQDDDQEIVSMAEVGSARPSLPKAIQGMLTVKRESVNHPVCEDGFTPAEIGWCGDVPDAPGFQNIIIEKWGGGTYVYTGIGKNGKPIADRLPVAGASKPIPGTQQGYPNGALPNGHGGFERDPRFQDFGQDFRQPQDPFAPDQEGFVRPLEEVQAQDGLMGWVWYQAMMRWKWHGPGPQMGPPPPTPGSTATQALVRWDHSDEQDQPSSRTDWYREQENARKEEEKQRREEEREQKRADEERRREDAERRREEEKQRRDEEKEERRRDDERRREDSKEQLRREEKKRDEEREQRRADEERAREDRKAAAELARAASQAQAEAQKEAARISSDAMKESARIQAENNKLLFDVLLKKSGDGGMKDVMSTATQIAGMVIDAKAPDGKTDAAEYAEAIKDAAPSVATAFRDSVMAVKGFSPQQQQWTQQPQPNQVPGAPPPQQIAGPPAPPQQMDPKMVQAEQSMRIVRYLARVYSNGRSAVVGLVADGCSALECENRYLEVEEMILQAVPEAAAAEFEKGCLVFPHHRDAIPQVRALATSPQGKAWMEALKVSIQKHRAQLAAARQAQAAPQGAPAPQQPVAPAKPVDPRISGVDPTRPVILSDDGKKAQQAPHDDPNHRDILPS